MNRRTLILVVILGAMLYAGLNVYLFKNPVRFGTKPPSYMELPYDRFGYPEEEVSRLDTRTLFLNREFGKLNDLLTSIQGDFERDYHNEYRMYDALLSLNCPVPEYEVLFADWVKAFPETFPPYLCRACYYWAMGLESRGSAWSKDTSREQFEGMRRYFYLALEDLEKALGFNPNLVPAFCVRISIHNHFGEDGETLEDLDQALAIAPECYLPRFYFINNLEPRWGGSWSRMNTFAKGSQKYAEKNPALGPLMGFSWADRAWYESRGKRYGKALKYFNKGLRFGNDYFLLKGRANCYYAIGEYEKAEKDINHALALRKQVPGGWQLRSKIHYAMGRFDEAFEEIRYATELAPGNGNVRSTWDWQAKTHKEKSFANFHVNTGYAIQRCKWWLKMDPENPDASQELVFALKKAGRTEEAKAEIRKAITLDPRDSEFYRIMGAILFAENRLDDIIFYWNKYIQLEPDRAEAYLERGGAYYRQGDMASAMRDLKKSCELGSERGCETLKKMEGGREN